MDQQEYLKLSDEEKAKLKAHSEPLPVRPESAGWVFMNNKQTGIWRQILEEKAKDKPDIKMLKKLAKDMERYKDDDLEFLGDTIDKVHKQVKHGARCYKYAKWY